MSQKYLEWIPAKKTILAALAAAMIAASSALAASPVEYSVPFPEEKVAELLKAYKYDRTAPLNATLGAPAEYPSYIARRVDYNGANGARVPGILHMPKKFDKKAPCVLVQHGYGGDKSMGSMFATALAPSGIAVFSIDAEYHGDRKKSGKDILSTDAESDARAFKQTIIDLSRAIDYLASRGDIDMQRIGYIGTSMGSFIGGVLAGVDERVNTAVLIVGGGDWLEFTATSGVSALATVREHYRASGKPLSEFAYAMRAVEPAAFIHRMSPNPLLMINCSNDKYVPKKTAETLFAAARSPKYIQWFTCDGDVAHIPPVAKTQSLVKKWFAEQFGLK
jgi:cephalosporin-C deacetylase-like acetyl esterase